MPLPNTIQSSGGGSTITEIVYTANHTFALADAGCVAVYNSGVAGVFTVPADAAVAFPVNTVIEVFNAGTGLVSIAFQSPVTAQRIYSKVQAAAQYASITLRKRGANLWAVGGNLA